MQRTLILFPVLLSSLVLGAHVLRVGQLWVALGIAALPLLLATGRRWGVTALRVTLAVGTVEWLRTLVALVGVRRELGAPYARLAAILAVVTLITAASVALLGRWGRPAAAAAERSEALP